MINCSLVFVDSFGCSSENQLLVPRISVDTQLEQAENHVTILSKCLATIEAHHKVSWL